MGGYMKLRPVLLPSVITSRCPDCGGVVSTGQAIVVAVDDRGELIGFLPESRRMCCPGESSGPLIVSDLLEATIMVREMEIFKQNEVQMSPISDLENLLTILHIGLQDLKEQPQYVVGSDRT